MSTIFARLWIRTALLALCLTASAAVAYCQSTFGTVLGTVLDPSGGVVPKAKVDLVNTGTNAVRSTETAVNGSYQFVNIDVGTYRIIVDAPGFQKTEFQAFDLTSRESKHIDIELKVASQATTVTVEAIATIQTDASNIAESKGALELTDLPVAIFTRSQGSTSAFSTLTAQPGVQTDANNNITVSGASPSQISITVDGISTAGPGFGQGAQSTPLSELFPSFNAIEEIKISETLNPAEFGGVADITTVSKSGTNNYHGGLFENFQNSDMNAADFFSHEVTQVKLNDFGAYLGGPVIIPKLYNGRNRTFFFGSYEVLRLPKSLTSILSVPTQAMRNGDLSAYLDTANGGAANQLTGFPGNIIPPNQLNPYAQKLLNLIYPLPNYGPPTAVGNNYLATYPIPINSAQGDVRIDQVITPKHMVYARYTYKNRRIEDLQRTGFGTSSNPSSPLLGGEFLPQVYNALTAAYNWVISPSLVNELRGGFTKATFGVSGGPTAQQVANTLGLTAPPLPGAIPSGEDIPTLAIAGFTGIQSQSNDTNPREATYQILDTLTWTHGKHTIKFGGDFRYMSALFTQALNYGRLGIYDFNGSVTSGFLGNGEATPIAGFLLGYPDLTTIGTVVNPNTSSYARNYALFVQDDWKISRSLTLNYGLRWEYHPGFLDHYNNEGNFDPYYTSTQNGQTVNGAVVIPNQAAFANVNPVLTQAIYPTPIITAAQAGLPQSLRTNSKLDFAPRVGFAYRIGGNNKTVLRGGYGRFIESLLSGTAVAGWAVESQGAGSFVNSLGSNGLPTLSLPYSFPSNIAQPGSEFFEDGFAVRSKDPIVEEWDLTLERDLGKGVGLRASYDGNHSYNLPMQISLDQPRANTSGFSSAATQAAIPFPLLAYIDMGGYPLGFGNYQAGTVSVHKRSSSFQFEASYVFTRNLTNANGAPLASASATVNEFGNVLSDPYHPDIDYGNTPYSRRNRFLATFLYELPFGKGKMFLNNMNRVGDTLLGGWVLSGLMLFQTGPFMSVATLNDPSGTGFNLFGAFTGNGGRADTVAGVNPYADQSINQWINPAAFANPPNNIGRFGDSMSGAVQGPGTQDVSMSLLKRFALTESARLELGAQVSNLFNHPNFGPPNNLTLGVPAFGQITSLQSAEGAGPRAIQLTGRITF